MVGGDAAQRVAVVERLGAAPAERADRVDVREHGFADALQVVVGVRAPQRLGLLDGEPGRDVAVERVVRARLVRHDVDGRVASHELRQHLGGVAEQADRERAALRLCGGEPLERVVERARALVQVAGLDAALDPLDVDLDAQRAAARSCVTASGWAPPIPPSPAVTTSRPASEPPKRLRAIAANVSYVPWRIPCVPM